MSPVLLLILLTALLLSLFVIIPKYASPKDEAIIQDWVGMGFNGLLFLIVLYETKLKYANVYYAIVFFLVALAVALSGVYWWIPKYIKKKQSDVTRYLFVSTALLIILAEQIYKSIS